MGILDFIFGTKKENTSVAQKSVETVKQAPDHYVELKNYNVDIVDGMMFHATCQLRTPLSVFKHHGEVYTGSGVPPLYGEPRDGVWLSKVKDKYRISTGDSTVASDAGGRVTAAEYVDYAIGLLSIFEGSNPIQEKMNKALGYSKGKSNLERVEKFILKYYKAQDISEVMRRFISIVEAIHYFSNKPGHLDLIDGVNKTINESLQLAGIDTIQELKALDEKELLAIKGVGKASALKISEALSSL